jgi:hypothetical protein
VQGYNRLDENGERGEKNEYKKLYQVFQFVLVLLLISIAELVIHSLIIREEITKANAID